MRWLTPDPYFIESADGRYTVTKGDEERGINYIAYRRHVARLSSEEGPAVGADMLGAAPTAKEAIQYCKADARARANLAPVNRQPECGDSSEPRSSQSD